VARTLGLRMLGLDYITPDISQPWQAVGGCFIEINAVPALDVSREQLREGLPLSALTGALIWPGELDEAWQQVLTRHAEALHTVRSPAQWQAILQSFCEFPHAPDQRPVPR
jgi:hypothetical protein